MQMIPILIASSKECNENEIIISKSIEEILSTLDLISKEEVTLVHMTNPKILVCLNIEGNTDDEYSFINPNDFDRLITMFEIPIVALLIQEKSK